ncbi:exodeoxyribonuclease VII large subunit [Magnetospirillum sulfuroxidans]|uniref:Exodeoxyribonuclease 7 large subunit n=1 Tax=Magnetospirillum sulfuroxidans TaxID=611300 RepID=A0ABS5IG41_9PROT|nr:exodeoxyribonuclease VII large subunit [Magnetospirillum sulfuroxidans]MBR9973382.1 exodeoxyribonuclease VII large subunit [Magnetospirillum sulfuroxidans]
MTEPRAATNVPEFSVAELSGALKRTVEETFAHVRVRGEISGFKRHSSGHLYFALKDADAVLDAVCWRGQAAKLGIAAEDGMEVIATGRLTTYPGRSKYQMVVERMELAGQGALLKLLEDRRRKLAAEGLFEQARKRPIPFLPQVIGVITSPTGAVIRDILHRLADRFPRRVLLWPVAVQGDAAAAQIAAAIAGFNALPAHGVPRPDVLIVARGGGSVEDLWAFNEEIVVRAAAASVIPLISAVGHETDTTLIDFAADLRAPTPTAAAEKAVPVRAELIATVADCSARLVGAMARGLEERRTRLHHLSRALPNPRRVIDDATLKLDDRAERLKLALPNLLHRRQAELDKLSALLRHPRELLATKSHQLDSLSTRLNHALKSALQGEKARLDRSGLKLDQTGGRLAPAMTRLLGEQARRLEGAAKLLESYSYKNVLARGFAVIRDDAGTLVSAADAVAGAVWSIEFKDGKTEVAVGHSAAPRLKPKGKGEGDGRQGSLL